MSNPLNIQQARTLLFVPGNHPERFDKAVRSGADAVVLDLEDSVPPNAKHDARRAIVHAWSGLQAMGLPLVLRINPETNTVWRDDLALLNQLPGLAALMVPKAESADSLGNLHSAFKHLALLPLIETAAGWFHLNAIAQAPGIVRLALGHIDFMADTGMQCSEDENELAPLRFAITMATRLANLPPAIDGVTVQTQDVARLRSDTQRAKRFGFGGKLCIHPTQIAPVHEAFAPSVAELAWAQRVMEADAASGGAAVQLDGRMVDAPVVLAARRVVNAAVQG
jgi:citrate lyase subunit beta / citryl-CoA lyase